MSALRGIRAEHRRVTLDYSAFSAVTECACGLTFLRSGVNRKAAAAHAHDMHVYEVMLDDYEQRGTGGALPIEPSWEARLSKAVRGNAA